LQASNSIQQTVLVEWYFQAKALLS
jgi:hypothetical protein